MSRRRRKWGCPNRNLPHVVVEEVRIEAGNAARAPTRTVVALVQNALAGQYAEPQEHLRARHLVPVDIGSPRIVGWWITFDFSIPKEWWFFRRPDNDSWSWRDEVFVPVARSGHQDERASWLRRASRSRGRLAR